MSYGSVMGQAQSTNNLPIKLTEFRVLSSAANSNNFTLNSGETSNENSWINIYPEFGNNIPVCYFMANIWMNLYITTFSNPISTNIWIAISNDYVEFNNIYTQQFTTTLFGNNSTTIIPFNISGTFTLDLKDTLAAYVNIKNESVYNFSTNSQIGTMIFFLSGN